MVNPHREATPTDATDAFRAHVVPELQVLLRVAGRMTGNPTDAEDLVQETLIRAYRAADRFDGRHPRAWLLTIMRNTWKNMNRRHRFPTQDVDVLANVPGHGPDGRNGPEELVVGITLSAELVTGLRQLSRPFRQVVLLVDVDGLSYQETADVLGIPSGTVMSRLHRARRRLRKLLEHPVVPGGEEA